MRLETICLQNFKCYEALKLELHPNLNLFYGINATGKTALLEGICAVVGAFFSKLDEVEKRNYLTSEIRLATLGTAKYPAYQFPVITSGEGVVLNKKIAWKRTQDSIGGGVKTSSAKQMTEQSALANKIAQNGDPAVLPVVAYFSTRRLFTDRKESEKKPLGRKLSYYNALNDTSIKKTVRSWLKDSEYAQYQRRQTDANYTDETLESLKTLVLGVLDGEYSTFYYDEPSLDERLEAGIFFQKSDGTVLPESLLSDGYRNFIWLVIEIAWRCAMLNPGLHKADIFNKTDGVVLIDELDLHLHPKWQQKVIAKLTESFPAIQFFITTHSPIVLGTVKKGRIFKLEGFVPKPMESMYGLQPSYILEVNMGVDERLPELKERIADYFGYINAGNGKSEEALALRQELEKEMSVDDPMFTKADTIIELI